MKEKMTLCFSLLNGFCTVVNLMLFTFGLSPLGLLNLATIPLSFGVFLWLLGDFLDANQNNLWKVLIKQPCPDCSKLLTYLNLGKLGLITRHICRGKR